MPDFTIAHPEDVPDESQNTERESASPKCKRMKLLKHPLKKTKDNVDSSSEDDDSKTRFSTYDFKCSKFCFKKCQCDIRLSQDFEPMASTSAGDSSDKNTKLSVPDITQCQLVTCADSKDVSFKDNSENVSVQYTENDGAPELDLFDEAVALSGSAPLSQIGVTVFDSKSVCNDKETELNVDKMKQFTDSESIYEDVEDDVEGSSTPQEKRKVRCCLLHKHNNKCSIHTRMIRNGGLEGLAVVSTGAKSLTSHLVDIIPHWSNLKRFAVIHTGTDITRNKFMKLGLD